MIKVVLVFLGIPFGIALVVFGAASALNASSLQSRGKVAEATITQSQTSEQNAYEIKYEFRLGNGPTVYSHSDELGRQNLWDTVSVKPTGTTVQVRYLPSDPWVNRAVTDPSKPVESALTAVGAGVFIAGMGLLLLVSDIRAWRRKRSPTASASQ